VHHFFKVVSEKDIIRPAWYFDVSLQGEGIVDVTTHLVDLVQWKCFPEFNILYVKTFKEMRQPHLFLILKNTC
jgi:hypothetical protein